MREVVVITGASSGIGLAVVKDLLNMGYFVIGVARNEDKCDKICKELGGKSTSLIYFYADMSIQSNVKKAAREILLYIKKKEMTLQAVINNVGGISSCYQETEDNVEFQLALNHLASFLFTYELLPIIKKDKSKIIFTSSESHKGMKMRWNNLFFKKHYSTLFAYKQSKLSNLLFAKGLNEKYNNIGVVAYCVDPGLVNTNIGLKNTKGIVNIFWSIRMKHGDKPEIPAKTYTYLVTSKKNLNELYFRDSVPKKYSKQVNISNSQRLWKVSEKYCNITWES